MVLSRVQDHRLPVLVVVWDTDPEVELLEHRVKDFLEEMELIQQILLAVEVVPVLVDNTAVH